MAETPLNIEDEGQEASAEEQKNYDLIVENALEFIHSSKATESIDGQLARAEQVGIPGTVGRLAAQLTVQQLEAAKQSGVNVNADTAMQATGEIVEELIETGMRMGHFTFANEEQMVSAQNKALRTAQQGLVEVSQQTGLLDVDQMRKDVADFVRDQGPQAAQEAIRGFDTVGQEEAQPGGVLAEAANGQQIS